MRLVIALAAVAALAACSQQPAESQSVAGNLQTVERQRADTSNIPDEINIASEEGRRQLRTLMSAQLDQIQDQFAEGHAPDAGLDDQFPMIGLSESPHEWRVSLNPGISYRFIGACDADCTNVDLELVDPAGASVASDFLDDDFPVMTYVPTAAGTFTVRAHLRNCTHEEVCMMAIRTLVREP